MHPWAAAPVMRQAARSRPTDASGAWVGFNSLGEIAFRIKNRGTVGINTPTAASLSAAARGSPTAATRSPASGTWR
jgi:hypothetical protein